MEPEDLGVGLERFQTKSGANARLGSPGDEEFDGWDLMEVAGKDGEKGGCGFLVLTLVQRVDDDEGYNSRLLERLNNELLHLGAKGLFPSIEARRQDGEQFLSKARISESKLEGEGGEDGS
jgi:hypothetical protein